MQSLKRTIRCAHGNNVAECGTCVELVPTSFWNRMAWTRFQPEPNTYHVTTLTGCLAKSYFEQTSPAEDTVESAWSKLRGSLIHYVTRSLGWNELRVQLKFELEGETIMIIGYLDAFDPETATIYDLKTTRFVKWQDGKGHLPRENHIAQVQCYASMFDQYGIQVNRLVLLYVDDKDIVAKQVPLGNRKEWMIHRASILHKALKTSQLPEPEVSGSCKYCAFINACPKRQEVLLTNAAR